ncbi:unnamed protein product, partial [Chrysoparadoxa australica]
MVSSLWIWLCLLSCSLSSAFSPLSPSVSLSKSFSAAGGPRIASSRPRAPSALRSVADETREDETKDEEADDSVLSRDLLKQFELFKSTALPFFQEEKEAKLMLAGVLALTFLNSGVSVAFSYIGKDFWNALSSKNPEEFAIMLQRFLGALVAGVPVSVYYRFQREKLALAWREWLSQRVMAIYYSEQTYYALEASKEIDNPDQRIAEDVRAFTSTSLSFLITIITSCIDLVSFSAILYSIYPQLFVAIIAYAAFGTVVTTSIGQQLVPLNFAQLQKEADFRYSLIRVRENSESIAFYKGEELELGEIQRRLASVLENLAEVITTQRNLEYFTTSYRYLIQVLPGFVVAPLYFAGKIELGVVSQSYGAFNHILGDLSIIVNQFEALSSFSAGVDRLGEFLERMQYGKAREGLLSLPQAAAVSELTNGAGAGQQGHHVLDRSVTQANAGPGSVKEVSGVKLIERPGALLDVKNLSVSTPSGGRELVHDLTFSMGAPYPQRILITGESGTGKSSLLRCIAGLWSEGSGCITRPPEGEMFFLPQKPYCCLSSLRHQITYPQSPASDPDPDQDAQLLGLLRAVDLPQLAARMGISPDVHLPSISCTEAAGCLLLTGQTPCQCPFTCSTALPNPGLTRASFHAGDGDESAGLGATRDWSDMLSLGEQQRLAFARLLFNMPRLAILDEATSALDLNCEARMYQKLEAAGMAYISVGHRPSLLDFH